ncbi:hypothetical protein BS47DRAFT_1367868 [Hydnum rufescens UP504]|uniref:Uncharacterized protein n=1 Tax=Hydnum rufescens UP504 TaxID=1448309 RepID=A0A9P6AI21_9AGAM|nr:hypothetical protein BS47DRAFT_1367868 [Hydnum rufescens UP504]
MVPRTPQGRCVALLATWTLILHDNELNAGPHTHSSGCVVIVATWNLIQEPSTRTPTSYMMTDEIQNHMPPVGCVWLYWVSSPTMKPHLKQAHMKPRVCGKTHTPMLTTYTTRGQAQYHTPAVAVPLLAQNTNAQPLKITPKGSAPEHRNRRDDGQSMVPHLLQLSPHKNLPGENMKRPSNEI